MSFTRMLLASIKPAINKAGLKTYKSAYVIEHSLGNRKQYFFHIAERDYKIYVKGGDKYEGLYNGYCQYLESVGIDLE